MMKKLESLTSADIVAQNIETLKQLFPTIIKEGQIDVEELKALLTDEAVVSGDEYYRFTWAGKAEARAEANKASTATLRPDKESSKDWDTTGNIFIEGDNLEVLKLLQKSYSNKIKMIYIDPPYNTGKDFVYQDNYRDNLANYLEQTGQLDEGGRKTSTNSESDGRYHSNWLNMMYPRLRLARNLMSEDGVIFISIDDNEQANLKKLCDEVFGEENFVADLIWQKKTGASDAKEIAIITENILTYRKQSISNVFSINKSSYDLSRYRYKDEFFNERGPYYIDNLDRGGLQYSDSLNFGIQCPDGSVTFPNGRSEYYDDGWIWKWSETKVNWGFENGFIEFRESTNKKSGWAVCYKNYLNVDNEGNPIERGAPHKNLIQNILNANANKDLKELFDGYPPFSYPKPIDLVKYILNLVEDNSLILDFFSGSGTTAHAVMQLNAEDGGTRKCISVQLPEPTDEKSEAYKAGYSVISDITKERIRRAGEKIKDDNKDKEGIEKLDVGFKAFKLDSSNVRAWDSSKEALEQQLDLFVENNGENIKTDRTEEDILFEVLLKYGLDLSIRIEKREVANTPVYNIGFGSLFICLANKITTVVAEGIGAWKEELQPDSCRVIFKDTGFSSDADKTNSMQILKRFHITEVATI